MGHYEERRGRGFHHHDALSSVAYGFLTTIHLITNKSAGGKNFAARQVPACPRACIPRGSPARGGTGNLGRATVPSTGLSIDRQTQAAPLVRSRRYKAAFVAQQD